jgi:vitamin B12 transporter
MKKIITFIIIFILSLSSSLIAEIYQGYVYNQNKRPLQEVLVIHGQNSTFSQENGYFKLNSKAEADSLIIYYAFHEIIKINKGDFTKVMNFTMLPLDIELDSFTFTTKRKNNQLPNSQEMVRISLKDKPKESNNLAQVITQDKSIKLEGVQLAGEKQTASILGQSSRHTLVMLDGIPLNNSGEDFDLASIPVELVDEVEIYKNNVSSLSGGGGMAGVINIKTRKSSNNSNSEFSLNRNDGSYNFHKVSLTSGFNIANTSVYAVFSKQKSDNNFKYKIKKGNTWKKLTRENNSKESINAMLNLASKFSYFDFYYSGNLSQYDNQLPGPTNYLDLYNGAFIEGYDLYNNFKLQKSIRSLTNTLEVYFLNKDSEYKNLKPNIPLTKADNHSENKRRGIKLKNSLSLDKWEISLVNSQLVESYSHSNKFQPASNIEERFQYSYASSLVSQYSDNHQLFNYNLISSLRYDKHNRFDDFVTYRLSGDISYDHIIKPSLLFSYGSSFTFPSFYSLYWKGDSHAVGNPDLRPEESQGYQIGLTLEYSTLVLKMNHSLNEIDNLIQWVEVQLQGKVWKPLNIGSSQIANYELEANWEVTKNLRLSSKVLFTDTKNKTRKEDGSPSSYYGKELVYIPDYSINLAAEYSYNKYNFKIDYNKTGPQWITQDNLKDPLASYELVNLSLSKVISHNNFEHNLNLKLNNLLNKYYEIYSYNPQAPFNYSLGYTIKYYLK